MNADFMKLLVSVSCRTVVYGMPTEVAVNCVACLLSSVPLN